MSPIRNEWHGQRLNPPNRRGRARRTVAIVAGVVVTAVLLSGCFGLGRPGPAGTSSESPAARTSKQITDELSELPGVNVAFVSTGPVGLPNQLELAVRLNLEADYPGDVPALIDYTLAMAWSATSEKPTTSASVGFLDGDEPLDLAPAAAELGWPGQPGPGLDVSIDQMTERYGPWPGPVPEMPAALALDGS